jgi:selenocysteine lyase/cysteine desulfurase
MSSALDEATERRQAAAFAEFLAAWPEYGATRAFDELRASDYGRLDELGQIYLDYTGGSLYADSQIREHMGLLRQGLFGNPHSSSPASLTSTRLAEQARLAVLEFFQAPPGEYEAIFGANASGALKLVGESYPFEDQGQYLLTFDNHNSVNGIREFARAHGAPVTYVPLQLPDMSIDEAGLAAALEQAIPGGHNLFAYPAQSNFSGVQHPLAWIAQAQTRGWDVVLDAAAFVPTNRLDLSVWKPDFVPISFYKMFGYPTGVGCLLARKEALARLRRPWFAGGTITVASVQGDRYYLAEGAAAFEDGTLDYLSLPAVQIGLRHLETIGRDALHTRVQCLTAWLLQQLHALHHSDGSLLVHIYGPLDTERRGGTMTMNFYDPDGRFLDHRRIEAEANQHNISLRTGCFCNPGGGETALGISRGELMACFSSPQVRLTMDDFRVCIDGKSTGAVRVSVGVASNFADVYRFVDFARRLVDQRVEE